MEVKPNLSLEKRLYKLKRLVQARKTSYDDRKMQDYSFEGQSSLLGKKNKGKKINLMYDS